MGAELQDCPKLARMMLCLAASCSMKYPFYTQSKPVVGHEACKVLAAIDQEQYVTNDAAMATVRRIAERRKALVSTNVPAKQTS